MPAPFDAFSDLQPPKAFLECGVDDLDEPRARRPLHGAVRMPEASAASACRHWASRSASSVSGSGAVPLTESDILGPSEAFRAPMDYYAHAPHTASVLEKLAREQPRVLACMHGSAWRGDGAGLLRALAKSLSQRELAVAA